MQEKQNKDSRREFLQNTSKVAVAALAFNLLGTSLFATNSKDNKLKLGALPKRILGSGRAALEVSALGFGCMGLNYHRSKRLSKKEAQKILAKAVELGYTLFDTAQVYGPNTNEKLVGELLEPFNKQVFITTKFGFGKNSSVLDSSKKRIKEVVENSLKSLRLEQIPLLYQHRSDPKTPIEEVVQTVSELIKEGKVARFGVCELNAQSIEKAHKICPITAVQSEYHLMWREVEKEILPTLERLKIGFVAYSPLNRGYLSGALTKDTKFDASNDNRAIFPRFTPEAMEANYKIVEILREFGKEKDASAAQVALAYLLHKKPFIVPLFGTTNEAHLLENTAALSVNFTNKQWRNLEKSLEKIEIVGDRYPASEANRVGK